MTRPPRGRATSCWPIGRRPIRVPRPPDAAAPISIPTRRATMRFAGPILFLLGFWWLAATASVLGAEPSDLVLWYEQPAKQWVEALPIGNGRLGAMIFGGTARERLQFNDDTLF